MAAQRKADYHIHYFADICAHDEMTLLNIETEAQRLGIEELCVLKHYSSQLPNMEKEWVYWKQVCAEQFNDFLEDIREYIPFSNIKILAGVESELLSDKGEINIGKSDSSRLDLVSLSAHWFPEMKILNTDPLLFPGDIGKVSSQAADIWREQIKDVSTESIIESLVSGYVKAVEQNPKIRVLAHMGDGLNILRAYEIEIDKLAEGKLLNLMEPLMIVCAEKNVLWEITEQPIKCEFIPKRANELGVFFSATVDAHFLHADGWSHLFDHYKAEEYIDFLGLRKGQITLL